MKKQYSENYGGAREGAGRPKIGASKPLRITLPEEDWKHIDELVASGRVASYAEYFRDLHQSSLSALLYKE